jgi:two-component system, NarL family, response regulator NreC
MQWPKRYWPKEVHPKKDRQNDAMSINKKIRCALVHDHVLLRQGLRRLLEDAPDMEVVAEAGNAADALQSVRAHRPDVVIADASVFELGQDRAESLIGQQSSRTKVLFLTMHENGPELGEALAGAVCAVRQTSAEQLVETVRKIHAAQHIAGEMSQKSGGRSEPSLPRVRTLTAREREVLKLLAEGRTVRSTAGVLGLSVKTVDAHKFNLMRKLGVHNKAELVMCAIQRRVVKLPVNL